MPKTLRRYIKFWVVVLGLVAGLTTSKNAGAQIGYWSELGSATPSFYASPCYGMLYNSGKLYISYLGSENALAVWNGNTWQNYVMPDTLGEGHVWLAQPMCMAADNQGNIYIAGNFEDTADGYNGTVVIKWNGVNFSKVGRSLYTGPQNYDGAPWITSLCKDSAGNIYAGGAITDSAGNEYVAKWDGNNWSILGSTTQLLFPSGQIITPNPDNYGGELAAYGGFVYAVGGSGLIRWDGSSWSNFYTPNSNIGYFVIGPTGNIYISDWDQVFMWNGTSWAQLGNYNLPNPNIENLYLDSTGNVYAINNGSDGSSSAYVAKWDGSNWSEVGVNNFALHANANITNLAVASTGDSIFAAGQFTNGVTASLGIPYVAVYTTVPAGQLFVYLTAIAPNCISNGTITTSVYQGTPPYRYVWSNGDTIANPDTLASGTYYVTVTDAHGLVATGDIIVPGGTCQSIIAGTVFVDTAGNCTYNGQQTVIPDVLLTLSGNSQTLYATTDANGKYSFAVPDTGSYYLYLQVGSGAQCGNYTLCGNPSHIIHVGVLGDTSSNNNFALTPDSNSFDLYLHPGWTSADPGFEKDYWIYFANNALVPFTGTATVAFKYDLSLTFLSSDVAYSSYNAATDSFTWVVSNFSNSGWNYIGKVRFHVPDSLPLNYQLHSQFWISPLAGDCDTSNNYLQYYETVIGAHDPNYKEVSPSGNLSAADSVLTYTINYQNTGTDSTYFITVTDNLSPYLNPATVRNLASSVPYSSFTISGTGLLTWKFVPYSLVDSATNPSGSKGFITFSVNKMSNAPYGAQVSNSASVYFDYAPAVVTNTVTDTVVVCTTHRTSENLSICQGGTAYIGTHPYTQAGTYVDTLTGIGNCDSIVTLNLTVTNRDTITRAQGLCAGDSVYFYGHYIYNPGSYDTLLSGGCDTLVILNLVVQDPLPITHLYDTICANSPILFNGHSIDTTGAYTAHYSSVTGCDSTVMLALVVNPSPTITLSLSPSVDSVCQGSKVTFAASPGGYYVYSFFINDSLVQQTSWDTFFTYKLLPGDTVSVKPYNQVCYGNPALAHVFIYPTPPSPTLTALPVSDTLCAGDTAIFMASSGYDNYIFSNITSAQQTGPSPVWITDQLGQGNFISVQGEISGCVSPKSNTVVMIIKPTPVAFITLSTTEICGDTAVPATVTVNTIPGAFYYLYIDSVLEQNTAQSTFIIDSLHTNDVVSVVADLNGCKSPPGPEASATLTDVTCLGIQQITATNNFTLYPNPADDYTMIDFNPAYTGSTVFVTDITGRQLLQTRLTVSPQQLPTGNLPSGVYLVTVFTSGQIGARLLVKE